jgi:hypothetical protein
MLMNMRKMLLLLTIVPLVSAGASEQVSRHRSTCPWERGRQTAAAKAQPERIATTVTLLDPLPAADGGRFGVRSGILNP